MKNFSILKSIPMVLFVLGCSTENSDPLKNFEKLETQTPQKVEPFNQSAVNPKLFNLKIVSETQDNVIQFTENVESSVVFEVTPLSAAIQEFEVELLNFNFQNKPELVKMAEPYKFQLKWKAPVGSIPAGQWGRSFISEMLILVTKAQNDKLIGTTNTITLPVIVQRTQAQPKIVAKTDLSNGIVEGEATSFQIEIEDPTAALDPRNPEVVVTPYINSNTEAYRADGSSYLRLDSSRTENPEKLSASRYKYFYVIDADRLPLNRDRLGKEIPVSTELDMCFYLRAVSAVGTLSEQLQVCTKARYKVQPTSLTWSNPLPETISTIQPIELKFDLNVNHPLAEIQILDSEAGLKTLSGTSALNCQSVETDKLNHLACSIQWTPPCRTADSNRKLTLKIQNKLDGRTVTTTQSFQTIVKAQKSCAVKKGE